MPARICQYPSLNFIVPSFPEYLNQYVNPSASKLIIDYDYTWKGDLHVTPIEISNGFGVDRIRARL